jgi:DNA-binding transcriptional ArsR family regulator
MKNEFAKMSDEAVEMIANRFKLLSEPVRLRILQSLEQGRLSVTDLAAAVATTQPNVSKHLKMMQDAGIISRKQDGNTVYYSIADQSIFELCDVVCKSLKDRSAEISAVFG